MKTITILAGKLHPYGGVETHLFHFCKTMAASANISLFITSKTYDPDSKKRLKGYGVTIAEFRCGSDLRGILEYVRCLFCLWASRSMGAIFYSNGTSGFARLAFSAVRPALWIHHHHGDIIPSIIKQFPALYRTVLRQVDWLVACTPQQAQALDTTFDRKGRTVCLPYFFAEPRSFARKYRAPARGMTIGFFGRIRESKGINELLALGSWFDAHHISCRLHGDDCEGLMSKDLPHGISWFGPYDSATDLDELLDAVDVVVLPTTFPEGLPLVASEAITRGVPLVAYDGGGLRELRNFHMGVTIIPPKIEDLKTGLLEMMERLSIPGLGSGLANKYRIELGSDRSTRWWLERLAETN